MKIYVESKSNDEAEPETIYVGNEIDRVVSTLRKAELIIGDDKLQLDTLQSALDMLNQLIKDLENELHKPLYCFSHKD